MEEFECDVLKFSTPVDVRRRLAGKQQTVKSGGTAQSLSERMDILDRMLYEDADGNFQLMYHIRNMLEEGGHTAEEGALVCSLVDTFSFAS